MKNILSLLRKLEYDELAKIQIDGKILDLGGDRKSGYHELIKGDHQITVVNISENYQPDLKFNIEQNFPLESDTYDGVVCLNVLEHIFNYQNVLDESYRILKLDGIFVGAIPFLFSIHGSPDDYFRYTRSALERIFAKSGFRKNKIRELGSGLFSVIYQLKFGIYRLQIIRILAQKYHLMLDKILLQKILKSFRPNHHLSEKYIPLGYFFIAKK